MPPGGRERAASVRRALGQPRDVRAGLRRSTSTRTAEPFDGRRLRGRAAPRAALRAARLRLPRRGDGTTLAYSGDSGPSDGLAELARDADLFLCEATLLERRRAEGELRGHLAASEAIDAFRGVGRASGCCSRTGPTERPLDGGARAGLRRSRARAVGAQRAAVAAAARRAARRSRPPRDEHDQEPEQPKSRSGSEQPAGVEPRLPAESAVRSLAADALGAGCTGAAAIGTQASTSQRELTRTAAPTGASSMSKTSGLSPDASAFGQQRAPECRRCPRTSSRASRTLSTLFGREGDDRDVAAHSTRSRRDARRGAPARVRSHDCVDALRRRPPWVDEVRGGRQHASRALHSARARSRASGSGSTWRPAPAACDRRRRRCRRCSSTMTGRRRRRSRRPRARDPSLSRRLRRRGERRAVTPATPDAAVRRPPSSAALRGIGGGDVTRGTQESTTHLALLPVPTFLTLDEEELPA